MRFSETYMIFSEILNCERKFRVLFSILRFARNFHLFFQFSRFSGMRSDTRFYNSTENDRHQEYALDTDQVYRRTEYPGPRIRLELLEI